MRVKYIIGGVIVLIFVIYGATAFKKTLTPYVNFKDAVNTASSVQIKGTIVNKEGEYNVEEGRFSFYLKDESNDVIKVSYKGVKPGNFDQAISVVAIGKYNKEKGEFFAEQLLVKCPSKYQGEEEVKSYSSERL
jgi:cytochrome c-type biogenesis protein CcmE